MKRLHGSYGAANLTLDAEKNALRKRMRALRKRLAAEHPEAAIAVSLRRSAGVPPALSQDAGETPALRLKVLASYFKIGAELDPQLLEQALVSEGWTPCLPRVGDREGPLAFHAADGPLAPDAFGIPAPLPSARRLTPDLLLVPLLAFDRSGGRLGQGVGCYDRTIAALRAVGTVRVIGLAYAGQQVELVPTGPHDQRLDGILTDKEFIEVVHASA